MALKFSFLKVFTGLSLTVMGISISSAAQQPQAEKVVDSGYTFKAGSPDGIGKRYFGREIARIMGAAGGNWLERTEREEEEHPALAIDSIRLPATASIADIGAGTGYYSFRLARRFPRGHVFAVEIQDELIGLLKDKKRKLRDSVVTIVKSTATSPGLPDNSIDLAIMVDVYHELEYPQEMLQSLRKALKRNGEILLVEFRGEDPAVAIKPLHKTSVLQLNRELGANGFKLVYRGEFLPVQHFLLYRKE